MSGDKKISIIIPCYPPHVKNIKRALDGLRSQTRLPDEVVVALSETTRDEGGYLEKKCSDYPFPVNFYVTAEKQFAGQNRNRGAAVAANEILVFCDSDDEYHPQKLEITEYVFREISPKLFLHGFKRNNSVFDLYDKRKLSLVLTQQLFGNTFGTPSKRNNSLFIFTDRPAVKRWVEGSHPHHGYPSISRDVFEKVKYRDLPVAEDTEFCLDVLWEFKSAVYADVNLLNYHYCYNKFVK